MTAIPLATARRLTDIARRTAVVRLALALIIVGSAVAAVAVARHPHTHVLVPLSARGDTIVVLDLSASISTDTYSQIGATLATLASSNRRLGLVLFSDQAYEALPQGTPAADLAPLVRLFTLPKVTRVGFAPTLPPNPWTAPFSGGTKISAGMTLAHTIAVSAHGSRPTVVLISDLSDDPRDLTRLASILLAYGRDRVPVRIVGLDPAPADLALFRRSLTPAPAVVTAPAAGNPAPTSRTPFPWPLVLCALLVCFALGLREGWSPRLDWGRA
jgi:hypothetical protein